jgi:hypothetical protein
VFLAPNLSFAALSRIEIMDKIRKSEKRRFFDSPLHLREEQ